MASSNYAAWSVIAGEQPTTAKWNILGTNDAAFNTGQGFNDGIITARHMEVQQTWQTVSYINGFTQYSSSWGQCQYYKDTLGIVHFRGLITGGGTDTNMFVLPSGYRPSIQLILAARSSVGMSRIDVGADGVFTLRDNYSADWLSLSSLTYRAEQ